MTPTTADLKREYHRAKLWCVGVTIQKAVSDPLIRLGLELAAKAHSKTTGKTSPTQMSLI
jgi:hypothetical protein